MKKQQRCLALLLAAVLILTGLAGCAGETGSKDPSGSTKSTVATNETQESTGGGVIKVGTYMPLTGLNTLIGIAQVNAIEQAIDELNQAGGALGMQYELIAYDDKSSPEESVKDVTRLIEVDDVDVIIGSNHGGNLLATGEMIQEAQIPCMGTSGSDAWMEEGWDYIFRSSFSGKQVQRDYLSGAKALGAETVVVFHSQDEANKGQADNIVNEIAGEVGMEVVGVVSMMPGDQDFTGQCAQIMEINPDAVVVTAVEIDAQSMVKQLRNSGYTGVICGEPALGTAAFMEIVGKENLSKIVFAAPFIIGDSPEEESDPKVRAFFEGYYERYNEMPATDCAARAYDAMYLLHEAIVTAGTLDGPAVREALDNIEGYVGVLGTWTIKGSGRDGLEALRVYTYDDNGERILVEDYLNK